MAKTAGFCFGVQRAIDKVYEAIKKGDKKVYTLGPIIHNEEVTNDLIKKDVKIISEDELERVGDGVVVIRSHGVAKSVYDFADAHQITLLDATCPYVKKIHNEVWKHHESPIIIIGDKTHPEVQGIIGWCQSPSFIVNLEEDIDKIPFDFNEKCVIVGQTTFNRSKFQIFVENISKRFYNSIIIDTICTATHERQQEADQIASDVEVMLVIGGKNSSNTQKLFEICKGKCEKTYYIQTKDDIKETWLSFARKVGITAGASTPSKIIEEVQLHVRDEF